MGNPVQVIRVAGPEPGFRRGLFLGDGGFGGGVDDGVAVQLSKMVS